MRQATYTKKFIGFTALVDPDWDDEFAYDDILTTIARRGSYDCLGSDYMPASFDNGNYPILRDNGEVNSAHHLHPVWRNRYYRLAAERQAAHEAARRARARKRRRLAIAARQAEEQRRADETAQTEQQRQWAIEAALAEEHRQRFVAAQRAAEAERFIKLTDGVAMSEQERLDWLAYLHSNRGSV